MVSLSSISSIAKHTYIVDGAARVYEVTVADKSSAIARFYFIEPVTDQSPLNVGQVVIDRIKSASKEVIILPGEMGHDRFSHQCRKSR